MILCLCVGGVRVCLRREDELYLFITDELWLDEAHRFAHLGQTDN